MIFLVAIIATVSVVVIVLAIAIVTPIVARVIAVADASNAADMSHVVSVSTHAIYFPMSLYMSVMFRWFLDFYYYRCDEPILLSKND